MALEDLKLRIKETPISHILGHYLPLTKRGANTLAVCPFHDDKNPSMHVNDQKNMFMCFVDNIGGDAISFVMRYKNFDFKEALKDICEKMGWDYQDFASERKQSPKYELGKKILTKASQLYRKLGKTKKFSAYNDFVINRKIGDPGASQYQLGFAPADNALSNYLSSIKDDSERNKALNLAKELGIIREDKYREGGHYDTFRERIMFPIWDQFGQVIGFTSRAISDKQQAKYMNSIDSFLFNKRNILYGLHFAKPFIRERNSLILVEGNMDQLTLSLNGFENSVAIMGVALSEHSLKVLKPITTNFYFALDNDQAGHKAMERINGLCLENGIIPKYVDLSPHKDPDEFILNMGGLSFKERMENGKTYLEYLLQKCLPESIPQNLDRKLDILQNIFQILSPLGDTVRASEHIAEYAKKLGLKSDPSQLNKNYRDFLKKHIRPAHLKPSNDNNFEELGHEQRNLDIRPTGPVTPVELRPKLGKAEKSLLQTLIQHPECLIRDEMGEILDFVAHTEVKEYILKLKNMFYEIDENEFVSIISGGLEGDDISLELKEIVGAAIFKYIPQELDEKTLKRIFKDLKYRVHKEKLISEKEVLKEKYKVCIDEKEGQQIIFALNEIDRQLIQLK